MISLRSSFDNLYPFEYGDSIMKMILPFLAVFCFALAGVGCKSTSCCGKCGGEAHGHSHADDKPCCGKDGKCCKKPE